MSRTQGERKAETRARLLDAAATLFAERGIDAVSVDAVADAAGRTSGAVYAHFGSKQGLLLALLDEWAHSLVTVIAAEFELAATVEDRLRAVATSVVTDPSDQTRRLLLLDRELWLRATPRPRGRPSHAGPVARSTRAAFEGIRGLDRRRPRSTDGPTRRARHGVPRPRHWIRDTTPPRSRRLDTAEVASALAMVTGAAPTPGTTASLTPSLRSLQTILDHSS